MEKKYFPFEQIKQKLANYCVYQDRCHQEVEQKMREFHLIDEAKEEILLFLLQDNFLNEERFAHSYVRGKFYQKKWGKNKIEMHLKSKGIGSRLISKAMQEICPSDYYQTLRDIYELYYSKQSGTEFIRKNKSIKYLLSRGYDYSDITQVLEEC